jgi:hypothetical protein
MGAIQSSIKKKIMLINGKCIKSKTFNLINKIVSST